MQDQHKRGKESETYCATSVPEADAQRRNQDSDENLAEDFAASWHVLMASEENQKGKTNTDPE